MSIDAHLLSLFCRKTIPSQSKQTPTNPRPEPPSNTTVTNQTTNAPSARRAIFSIDADNICSASRCFKRGGALCGYGVALPKWWQQQQVYVLRRI
ncbi:hypothetical protein glysoja_007653 [Glycine soja]|nr:hypothetical protein glysoja_007653 [Glycine soja]